MLPAVLTAVDLGLLGYYLYKFFSGASKAKKGLEVIKTSGSFINTSKKSLKKSRCIDYAVVKTDGVISKKCKKKINAVDLARGGLNLAMLGEFIEDRLQDVESSDHHIDVSKAVKEYPIPSHYNGKTLLDVLEDNGKMLVPISQNLSSIAFVFAQMLPMIYFELQKLRESSVANTASLSVLLSSIAKNIDYSNIIHSEVVGQLSDIVDRLSKIDVSIIDFQASSNTTITHLENTIKEKSFDAHTSVNPTIKVQSPAVEVQNNVPVPDVFVRFDEFADILDNHLSKIAAAKELEKDHYEFLKTPKDYTLTDQALPKLSPREVAALSEAIKAHLNSQEATITADDFALDDYDVDFDDLINQLFQFKGIVDDLEKIKKDSNGS